MAVTGIEIWSAYSAGDADTVLKTVGAREGQGIDTATTPPNAQTAQRYRSRQWASEVGRKRDYHPRAEMLVV